MTTAPNNLRLRIQNLSLKTKISLAVSILLIMLVVTIGLVAINAFKSKLTEIVVAQQDTLVTRIAEDLDQHLSTIHNALIKAATTIPHDIVNDSDKAQKFLDSNAGTLSLFDRSIFIFSPAGTLIAESPFRPNRRGQDFSFREYIQKTVATNKPIISQPFVTTKDDRHTVLMFTAPVFGKDGQLIAIMTGSLGLTQPGVLGKIAKTKIGESGYFFLTTNSRAVILHPNQNLIMKTLAPEGANKLYDQALKGYEGTREDFDTNGLRTLTSLKPIKATSWILGAHYPLNEAYAPITEFTRKWMLLMGVGVILILALIWSLMRYLTNPLFTLTKQIKGSVIQHEKLSQIQLKAGGEIAELARAFNGMITQLNHRENDLRESEKRYRLMAENTTDMISRHTPDGTFIYVSTVCKTLLGYDVEELIGHSILEFIHPDNYNEVRQSQLEIFDSSSTSSVIYRMRNRDHNFVWLETTSKVLTDPISGEEEIVCVSRDFTARKKLEEELHYLALHDGLTSLPNRILINDRFQQAIFHANREDHLTAILVLDLDRFKRINDTLGHDAGDKVLKLIASRVQECVRQIDTVARPGGDEFVILLASINHLEDAMMVASKILASINEPFILERQETFITGSIGISIYPKDGQDATMLIKNADTALYCAKEQGGNNYQCYIPDMNAKALEHLSLENALHSAIERNELRVHYQPVIEIKSGQIKGVEALVRWEHPEHGLVSPVNFIPLAETSGLIVPIGEWVMRHACKEVLSWREQGLPPIRLAVNISGRQFRQRNLLESIQNIITETKFNPKDLDLELTESVIMGDPAKTVEILHTLKAMGTSISIDDFGTGYSSLSYLKRFPIDTLKIDRSFVQDITLDQDDAAIVRAVIALAQSLRLKVVAEGVETQEQLTYLQELNCDSMQGFLISRPLPPDKLIQFMRSQDKNQSKNTVSSFNEFKRAKKP